LTQKHEKQNTSYRSHGSYIFECTLLAIFTQITPYHKYNTTNIIKYVLYDGTKKIYDKSPTFVELML